MADLKPFRFWCSKVLPLVYDDSLSYYELLCKIVKYLNNTMEDVNELKKLVQDFLDSGEFTQAVSDKLDEMAEDGTLADLINEEIFGELNDQVAALDSRLDLLDNRTFIVFGDSYAVNDSENGITNNFVDMCGSYLGLTSSRWMNVSAAGMGFDGGVGSWKDAVVTKANSMTEAQRNAVTDIIFVGGRNDAARIQSGSSSTSIIGQNITTCANNVKTYFPNAKMYNAFVGRDWSDNMIEPMKEAFRLYDSAQNRRMAYFTGIENALHYKSLLRSDGIHPNMTGMYALAIALCNCILTGSYEPMYEYSQATASNGIGSIRVFESLLGDQVLFVMMGDTLSSLSIDSYKATGAYATAIKLAELSGSVKAIFRGAQTGYAIDIPCTVTVHATGGYYTVAGFITLADNNCVYLRLKQIMDDHTDFITFTSIDSIQLPHIKIAIPAMDC